MRPFNLIVCATENRVIGFQGRLPWSIPEDQRLLRRRTAGQIVVLGRICFETWPAEIRDGRQPVVITGDRAMAKDGVRVAASLSEALAIAEGLEGEIYVCGGERIFAEAIGLPEATRLFLTLVHAEVFGDRFFPDWRRHFTREIERRESADDCWRYTFLTLAR